MSIATSSRVCVRKNYRPWNRFMTHFTTVNAPLPTTSLLKIFWAKGECKNGDDYCKMYLVSHVLTLLDMFCKNMVKIHQEFVFDLGYYFIAPHLLLDLILEISKEEIGLITDVDNYLFADISMRGEYIFYRDIILGSLEFGTILLFRPKHV